MDAQDQIIHEEPLIETRSWSMYSKQNLAHEELMLECDSGEQSKLLAVSCPATIIRSNYWHSRSKESFPSPENRHRLSTRTNFVSSSDYSKLTNRQFSSSQSTCARNCSTRSFLSPLNWTDFRKGLKGSFMSSLIPSGFLSKKKSITYSRESNHSPVCHRYRQIPFHNNKDCITLNISGRRFTIQLCFLSNYPETLLGSNRRDFYYDKDEEEYFFDRDPESFRYICSFYYTGKLHLPRDECPQLLIDEINFFSIAETYMCDCCWSDVYEPGLRRLRCIKEEKKASKVLTLEKRFPTTKSSREKIWFVLENPEVCILSSIFHIFNVFVILTSIVANITETIPCSPSLKVCKEQNAGSYFLVDSMCVAFFTAEYVVRFIVCPNRLRFIISYMSIIDLLAILPYYISLVLEQISGSTGLEIDALVVLRILRVFRIFKVMRHSKRLQQLTESIKNSSTELGFILFIYIIVVVLCASVIYFAEIAETDIFASIPDGMWYAVVTSTTVG